MGPKGAQTACSKSLGVLVDGPAQRGKSLACIETQERCPTVYAFFLESISTYSPNPLI